MITFMLKYTMYLILLGIHILVNNERMRFLWWGSKTLQSCNNSFIWCLMPLKIFDIFFSVVSFFEKSFEFNGKKIIDVLIFNQFWMFARVENVCPANLGHWGRKLLQLCQDLRDLYFYTLSLIFLLENFTTESEGRSFDEMRQFYCWLKYWLKYYY